MHAHPRLRPFIERKQEDFFAPWSAGGDHSLAEAKLHLPRLVVLSYDEITRDTQIESMALVDDALAVR